MSKLILVPTPIGNLEDITLRSIRILKEAELIFSEDTRVTKKLLDHLGIKKKCLPFHAHNEHRFLEKSIEMIKSVELAVLVSDAGTPAISDPGFLLVRACIQQKIQVECLPGPTALIPALVASGFPCDKFVFEGFLPHKKGRLSRLKLISSDDRTIIFYESPHRLLKTLTQMLECFEPSREICIVREISKVYETFHRGNLKEMLAYFDQFSPKGEIVIIVKGKEH
jgi:16S rRNA (cytidine1402-2'-O)-methyltransferase